MSSRAVPSSACHESSWYVEYESLQYTDDWIQVDVNNDFGDRPAAAAVQAIGTVNAHGMMLG
jgi:hypothetical protein